MSTFNIPIFPFFVHIFLKTTQLSCRRKQFNSPPQLENQNHCRRKTVKLNRRKTTQLGNRNKKLNSSGENNSTQQQERNRSTQDEQNNSTREERNNYTQQEKTTHFGSRNETTQLCTAVDRLHRL
ncbi:hypothetical protein TNCV_3422121 [Trichonephila clavipes]|nr:hypothetical protein TNCV_3422121 [Trichonephila clavipes]